jgi:hypothetical protein
MPRVNPDGLLRRSGINLNLIWAAALFATAPSPR